MSLQTIQDKTNFFFDSLPIDLVRSIFSFLKEEEGSLSINSDNDRTILATQTVCRRWRDSAALREERQESSVRLHQKMGLKDVHREISEIIYPLQMRQVFQQCHTPIWQLPKLDLGNQMGRTNYIDFIQTLDMNQSVMKFTDMYDRPGIALKIQDPSRNKEVVLALFQKHCDDKTEWRCGWGNSDCSIGTQMTNRHWKREHGSNCTICPFIDGAATPYLLRKLLTNQDSDFKLTGHNATSSTPNGSFSQKNILVTVSAAIAFGYLLKSLVFNKKIMH
jgi:hypothetical protein